MLRTFLALISLFLLAGCQATPGTLIPGTPPPDAAQQNDSPSEYALVEFTAKIGDYELSITCKGSGKPTIILENRLGWISWYQPKFENISQNCIYSRAGMGSVKASYPRTTQDQVKDLHDLLQAAKIPGPYILVGHGHAVYNLVLFTAQYPSEVAGLVCIECLYPAYEERLLEKLNAEYAQDPEKEVKIKRAVTGYSLFSVLPDQLTNNSEGINLYASAKQVMAVNSLGAPPLIALVASEHDAKSVVPEVQRIYEMNQAAWEEGSEALSKLSTRGKTIKVPGTIPSNILANDAVRGAIQEVFNLVKR